MKFKLNYLLIAYTLLNAFNLKAQQKPNIIYILTDDLGYGDVSAYNKASKVPTQHIDALANDGMLFSDAHTNSSVCTPTRYGVLTGRYAWRTHLQNGVLWSYDQPLISKNRKTVASVLKEQGYHTACIGKWHLGLGWQRNDLAEIDFSRKIEKGPVTVGFDYFYGITASLDIPPYFYIRNDEITAKKTEKIYGTSGKAFWREGPIGDDFKHEEVLSHLTHEAETYISAQSKKSQPFFLYLPLPSPHTPILPTKEYLGKSGAGSYGDFVLMTDDMVGRILQAVKNAGIVNNTMIIFTSDNGVAPAADLNELEAMGHQSSYIFRGAKADLYEGGHRVPFIVKWPAQVAKGKIADRTICLTDFMATAAEITKYTLKDNEAEDSYSFLPLLQQKGNYKRTTTIHHSIDGNFAIRKGKWKLIYAYGSGGWSLPKEKEAKAQHMPPLQLFDLQTDLTEKENLITTNEQLIKTLNKELEELIDNGRSTPGKRQKNDVEVNYLKYK